MEYLVTMTTHVPEGTPQQAVEDVRAREAGRSRELVAQGHLLRLWRPPLRPGEWRTLGLFAAAGQGHLRRLWTLPGHGRALGLWQASSPAEMQEMLTSLPLDPWMTVQTTPLSPHPSDPPGRS